MLRIRLLTGILALGYLPLVTLGADAPARDADKAAIRKTTQAFTEAFERGDAAGAAGYMTAEAELTPSDAPIIQGREAIQKAYTDYFAANDKQKIALEPESTRFLSRDTALEEGQMKVSAEGKSPTTQRYSLLHVREDGKWLIAGIKEWPSDDADLEDLSWLVGSWRAKQAEGEMQTTYQWLGNKAFIRGDISIKGKKGSVSAMQIIGIDPNTDELTIWVFEAGGGVATGTCTRDGDAWVFQTSGTSATGGAMSAMNLLARINDDTMTWQPINITLDDMQLGNLPPVKVTRVKGGE